MLALRHASEYCTRRCSDMPGRELVKLFGIIPIWSWEESTPQRDQRTGQLQPRPDPQPIEDPLTVRLRMLNERARQAGLRVSMAMVDLWTVRDERRANALEEQAMNMALQDLPPGGQRGEGTEGLPDQPRQGSQVGHPGNQ